MRELRREVDEKTRKSMELQRQRFYAEDAERTFNWLIKDISPQCDVDVENLHEHFESKWKKEKDINKEAADNMFELAEYQEIQESLNTICLHIKEN
jgi:glucose-6-phosphate-specific signal transduction histidine kinase